MALRSFVGVFVLSFALALAMTATAVSVGAAMTTDILVVQPIQSGRGQGVALLDVLRGQLINLPMSIDSREITLSPGKDRAAFVSISGGSSDIYALDFLSGAVQQLTFNVPPTRIAMPRWSPDGAWIAYTSWLEGRADVLLVPAEGGTPRRIGAEFPIGALEWSPNSDALLFVTLTAWDNMIFQVDLAGGEKREIASGHGRDYTAVWSPDGERILFASERGAVEGAPLYLLDRDSTVPRRITEASHSYVGYRWSPDAKRIAAVEWGSFSRFMSMVILEPDTGRRVRIDAEGVLFSPPIWSPDGTRIAFSDSSAGGTALYVSDTYSGAVRRLDLGIALLPLGWQ
jgi:Tol biopolymer transport system component